MVDFWRPFLLPSLTTIQSLVRTELDQCNAQGPLPTVVPASTASTRLAMILALLATGLIAHGARDADKKFKQLFLDRL